MSQLLAINYVPECARVRDKVYNVGSYCTLFVVTDKLFLITDAVCVYSEFPDQMYAVHRAHTLAPKPLSSQEQDKKDVRAAEHLAGSNYCTSMWARRNHGAVRLAWPEDIEAIVKELGEGDGDKLLLLVNNQELFTFNHH